MVSGVWLILVGLLLTAAVADARAYRIPNWVCGAIAALFVATAPVGLGLDRLWPHLAVGAAVFAVGYLLYALTGMGAGDAKLGAAIALWVGPAAFQNWIMLFAFAMLGLAFILIGARRIAFAPGGEGPSLKVLRPGAPVPLGIALSASAILASPGFDPGLWIF